VIFVDSSVWIDFFRDTKTVQSERLAELLPNEELLVGDIVLMEVLQGCRSDQEFRTFYRAMTIMPVVRVGGLAIATKAAQNFRQLRARGITIRKTIDTLIATYCIEYGHALLASDRDFVPFFEYLGLERA
jgi:predicted nucleic acid-binding protein